MRDEENWLCPTVGRTEESWLRSIGLRYGCGSTNEKWKKGAKHDEKEARVCIVKKWTEVDVQSERGERQPWGWSTHRGSRLLRWGLLEPWPRHLKRFFVHLRGTIRNRPHYFQRGAVI